MQLASSFHYGSPMLRADSPLSDDQIRRVAPSIFADGKHESRSARYTYIPTIEVLRGLRNEGFQPFMICQTRVRDEGKRESTKHMLRLRHAVVADASCSPALRTALQHGHIAANRGHFRDDCHGYFRRLLRTDVQSRYLISNRCEQS